MGLECWSLVVGANDLMKNLTDAILRNLRDNVPLYDDAFNVLPLHFVVEPGGEERDVNVNRSVNDELQDLRDTNRLADKRPAVDDRHSTRSGSRLYPSSWRPPYSNRHHE